MNKFKLNISYKEVHKAEVKPFSTGAHIPFPKKYIGKKVYVVIPEENSMAWIFTEKDLDLLENAVKSVHPENSFLELAKNSTLRKIQKIKDTKEATIETITDIFVYVYSGPVTDQKVKFLVKMLDEEHELGIFDDMSS